MKISKTLSDVILNHQDNLRAMIQDFMAQKFTYYMMKHPESADVLKALFKELFSEVRRG